MASIIKITDQAYAPLGGSIVFYDVNSTPVATLNILPTGSEMPTQAVAMSSSFTISSPGYYDFTTGTGTLSDGLNDITLEKKPSSNLVHYGIGAAIGFILAKLLRL